VFHASARTFGVNKLLIFCPNICILGPIPMQSTLGTNCEEGILKKIVDCCKPNLNQEHFSPQTEISCELIK